MNPNLFHNDWITLQNKTPNFHIEIENIEMKSKTEISSENTRKYGKLYLASKS